jgi:hypothetical protein
MDMIRKLCKGLVVSLTVLCIGISSLFLVAAVDMLYKFLSIPKMISVGVLVGMLTVALYNNATKHKGEQCQ